MDWCVYDLETDGLLYSVTQTFCLVIQDEEGTWSYADLDKCDEDLPVSSLSGSIADGLVRLSNYSLRVGHNIQSYDEKVLQKLYDFDTGLAEVQDTLILSRMIWPDVKERDFKRVAKDDTFPKKLIGSHSLEAWGHRLNDHKGDVNVVGLTSLSQPVLDYCVQDVALNRKLWDLQCKRMPELLT